MIYLAAAIYVLTLVFFGGCLKSLLDERGRAEAAWREERRDLLVRIQAPQVAAAMDYNRAAEENPPAIDMSDGPMGDESYWMSREELAEKLAEEETARG